MARLGSLIGTLIFVLALPAFAKPPHKHHKKSRPHAPKFVSYDQLTQMSKKDKIQTLRAFRQFAIDAESRRGMRHAYFKLSFMSDAYAQDSEMRADEEPAKQCLVGGWMSETEDFESKTYCLHPRKLKKGDNEYMSAYKDKCSGNNELACNPVIFGEQDCMKEVHKKKPILANYCDDNDANFEKTLKYLFPEGEDADTKAKREKRRKEFDAYAEKVATYCAGIAAPGAEDGFKKYQSQNCEIMKTRIKTITAQLNDPKHGAESCYVRDGHNLYAVNLDPDAKLAKIVNVNTEKAMLSLPFTHKDSSSDYISKTCIGPMIFRNGTDNCNINLFSTATTGTLVMESQRPTCQFTIKNEGTNEAPLILKLDIPENQQQWGLSYFPFYGEGIKVADDAHKWAFASVQDGVAKDLCKEKLSLKTTFDLDSDVQKAIQDALKEKKDIPADSKTKFEEACKKATIDWNFTVVKKMTGKPAANPTGAGAQ